MSEGLIWEFSIKIKKVERRQTMTLHHCWRSVFSHCIGWRTDGEGEWEEEEEHVFNSSVRPYMFSIWQQRAAEDVDVVGNWHLNTHLPCYSGCSVAFPADDETQNLWSHFVRRNLRYAQESKINHTKTLGTLQENWRILIGKYVKMWFIWHFLA